MAYTSALQVPNRSQYEPSSSPSQAWNCGPTSVAFIADFYRDRWHSIEQNRWLISGMGPYYVTGFTPYWGSPAQTPTTAWQQADMLDRRGVPASVRQIDSLTQLHGLTDSTRRPTLVGIQMGRVPWQVRGHSFTGWHAVVVVCGGYSGGVRGFWVMDPNFPPGGGSRRFYSDAVMQWALISNAPRWCVVPDAAKVVAAPAPAIPRATGAPVATFRDEDKKARLRAGKPVRNGASIHAKQVGTVPAGGQAVRIVGRMKSTGSFDPWYIYKWYVGTGYQFVYSPAIDFASIG